MMSPDLTTVSSTTLRRNTKAILALAEDQTVLITRYGRSAFVLMSAAEFERVGGHDAYQNPRTCKNQAILTRT
ncbi:MAG: type II toxin-antitoxin system Phd/YefM family antitoxin [Paracoccaceae bacterium]